MSAFSFNGGERQQTGPGAGLRKHEILSAVCRLVAAHVGGASPTLNAAVDWMTPRERQTLDRLLEGQSEKQIAAELGLSNHTVHIYIKALHAHFEVASRAELLAKFVTAVAGPHTLRNAILPGRGGPGAA